MSTPTQTALDRVQRACVRPSLLRDHITIVYELDLHGIRVRGFNKQTNRDYTHIVGWSAIGLAVADPLMRAQDHILEELDHAGG